MPKIQLLEPHVAELIAAGEVVERPSSVVKELMENAIDAGASSVTVEIEAGGVRLIRITDDGCGIPRADVATAFLRHATSKVRTADDLESIGTLGFRGEALASIAAVSRVEMITRTREELAGTSCRIEGGSAPLLEDTGCPVGTSVYVRDLFYNVPARMKFLKKDVSEGNAVAAVVDCVALSHPEIAFRFIREGKQVLQTAGDGDMRACIYAIFGRELANNLIKVDYTLAGVRVWGHIGKPIVARANRAMQHFFINGRYVKTRTAAAATERAFQGAVMVGKFPACVLHLELPPEMVDVNVHPAKIEVRFMNERPIFDAVYHGVKTALQAGDTPKQASLERVKTEQPVAEQLSFTPPAVSKPASEPPKNSGFQKRPLNPTVEGGTFSLRDRTATLNGKPDISVTVPVAPPAPQPAPKPQPPAPEPPAVPVSAPVREVLPVTYLGEVYRTYLLAEQGGSLFFIDKHAAHERILYNRLTKAVRRDAQVLLVPVTVTLSHKEMDALLPNLSLLCEAGFDAEEFDGSLLVRSVPMMLTGEDVQQLIQEIAGGFLSGKQEVSIDRLSWIYHSVACRAAVKAGDKQSPEELEALACRVLTDDEVRYCPHGRPVCFELTRKELEKQFGRI